MCFSGRTIRGRAMTYFSKLHSAPEFSVVLTTYRRDFRKALESVLAQTLQPLEIMVIDDDPANCMPDWFSGMPSHVTYLRNSANLGVAASRNRGASLARGTYLVFHDDDDEMQVHKLARLHAAAIKGPADLISHGARIHLINEALCYDTHPKVPASAQALLQSNSLGGACCIAVCRDAFLAVGGFDSSLRADEDYELWMRLLCNGYDQITVLPEALVDVMTISRRASVSKSLEHRKSTFAVMEKRYAAIVAAMPTRFRRRRIAYFHDSLAYAALLSGQQKTALVSYWRAFRHGQCGALLKLLIAAINPDLLFRVRAWM